MNYKYITEDNLENKQNYMYSEYGGEEFLKAYELTRRNIIVSKKEFENTKHNVYEELYELKEKLKINEQIDGSSKRILDAYVKAFEVRKRLYAGYNEMWKPVVKNYRIYSNYLSFCEILVIAWYKTMCTKYVSCLLKVTDSLISVVEELDEVEGYRLAKVLKDELVIIEEINRGE